MNIIDAIKSRRSIRKFLPKNIEKDIIEKIIDAGILAPSAKNRQPWKFVVVANDSKDDMINTIKTGIEDYKKVDGAFREYLPFYEQTLKIMAEAPVTIFVLNTENQFVLNQTDSEKFHEMTNIQSIGAAIENMILAALEYGVGSLWICDIYCTYNEIAAWLKTDNQIIAAISFGYPDENPSARPRKQKNEVIEWK